MASLKFVVLAALAVSVSGRNMQKRSLAKDAGGWAAPAPAAGAGWSEKIGDKKYNKAFADLAARQGQLVNDAVSRHWAAKAGEGRDIEAAGEQARRKGISYNKQVEDINERALMKAIGDASDSATSGMDDMNAPGWSAPAPAPAWSAPAPPAPAPGWSEPAPAPAPAPSVGWSAGGDWGNGGGGTVDEKEFRSLSKD